MNRPSTGIEETIAYNMDISVLEWQSMAHTQRVDLGQVCYTHEPMG